MKEYKLLVIGAGAAGITAAVTAARNGMTGICIVERDASVGGVLKQCKHSGFGMGYYGEEMTGVEYANRLSDMLDKACQEGADIEARLGTMVTRITDDRRAFLSSEGQYEEVSFDRCLLATGCREMTLQSLCIAGTRPEGIYTAGEAQRMLNVDGRDVGDDIVVLGTGDIGQIMTRHYLDAGKNVIAMIEKSDEVGGLERNRREIIERYNVPVILRSTVVEVFGDKRITAVKIRNLDTNEESVISCSTLITAMGLIPERDILDWEEKQLPDWLSLCGNCDYVHDIVDSVSFQAEKLAMSLVK